MTRRLTSDECFDLFGQRTTELSIFQVLSLLLDNCDPDKVKKLVLFEPKTETINSSKDYLKQWEASVLKALEKKTLLTNQWLSSKEIMSIIGAQVPSDRSDQTNTSIFGRFLSNHGRDSSLPGFSIGRKIDQRTQKITYKFIKKP